MSEWLQAIRFTPLTYFFKGVTFLGNEEFLCLFLPFLYWCWRKRAGAHLIILVITASYFDFVLKSLFAFERPPMDLWLVSAEGYTFPSSHAVTAVVLWGYLAYEVKKKWFTIFCVTLVVLMAFSRVYLGVHYPRDVIAGLVVGAGFLHLYRWVIKWSREPLSRVNDAIKILVMILCSIVMLLAQKNSMIATGMGLLAGIYAGFLIEPHFADFTADDYLYRKVIRYALALLIVLAIWQAIEWAIPENISFKWFQYFIIGIWVTAASPWLFIQLRLAHRES